MNHGLDIPGRDQDSRSTTPGARTALVFGATGFIGRWLVQELLAQGIPTTAAVRSSASGGRLAAWLEDHGAATHGPAQDLARAHGLEHPGVVESLLRWSDFLLKESTRPARSLRPLV